VGTLFPPKVNFEFGREYKHPNLRKMHAVQSALAVRRERERRQSLKEAKNGQKNRKSSSASLPGPIGANPSGIPKDFRSSEKGNGSFNYTTVGISFVIFGSLMLIPIFAGGTEVLGLDWHHLLGIGGLLIAVGVLMIVVHILTEDDADVVEKTLEKYKAKMTRSASQNPIIEDVEYGVDSRRSSFGVPVNPNYIPNIGIKTGSGNSNANNHAAAAEFAKHFDQEPGGVVKV